MGYRPGTLYHADLWWIPEDQTFCRGEGKGSNTCSTQLCGPWTVIDKLDLLFPLREMNIQTILSVMLSSSTLFKLGQRIFHAALKFAHLNQRYSWESQSAHPIL